MIIIVNSNRKLSNYPSLALVLETSLMVKHLLLSCKTGITIHPYDSEKLSHLSRVPLLESGK